MTRKLGLAAALGLAASVMLAAQGGGQRPASPSGTSATQIGGKYVAREGGAPSYQNGKWIEITYGRPIKRGRDLWGSGANYGKTLLDGAPVWRAGANLTTKLKTEVPLAINGKTIAAGEYDIFIDLKPNAWTFILSTWPTQTKYEPENKDALYGAFNYTPDKDVLRAPMTLGTLPFSVDQLTWNFHDVTDTGGKMAIMWDTAIASIPFSLGK